jgi:signal peptidase I
VASPESRAALRGGKPARRPASDSKSADDKGADGKAGKPPRNEALEWAKSIAIAVVLFLFIRTFLVQAYSIPSESMEETLLVGDYLMANNAVFGARLPFVGTRLPAVRDPRRGEIVVFRPTYNTPIQDVVKRVIGTPGDTLESRQGVVMRNGKALDEPYVHRLGTPDSPIPFSGGVGDPMVDPERHGYHNHMEALLPSVKREDYHPTRDNWGPLVVPAGHYFLMGDNRESSLDSRFMGFIPREVIRGKPLFIYWSYDRNRDAPFPRFVSAARWGRIGSAIHACCAR